MGNGFGKVGICFAGAGEVSRRHDIDVILSESLDEGLGHSFCYIRPHPCCISSSQVHTEYFQTTTFCSISGASVSANTATPLSTALLDPYSYNCNLDRASAFESSTSFASIPLQPVPRSGTPPRNTGGVPSSGPIERGFLSGPIERGLYSGPMENSGQLQRSFSNSEFGFKSKSKKRGLMRNFRKAIASKLSRGHTAAVAPIKGKESDWVEKNNEKFKVTVSGPLLNSDDVDEDNESFDSQNLQWAQGKAGEDRVQVLISEEHGWVFVGIYDGFNGPDATDFLLSNLYSAVHKELKGLLWNDKFESAEPVSAHLNLDEDIDLSWANAQMFDARLQYFGKENHPCGNRNMNLEVDSNSIKKQGKNKKNRIRGTAKKWEENQRRWKCEWDRERSELDRRLKQQSNPSDPDGAAAVNHSEVLKALSRALKKTEESYLDIADKMVMENPELCLMGSCVLVMLMKGEDVYLMNVGDSRAVLAHKSEPHLWLRKAHQDLERINEETLHDLESFDGDQSYGLPSLASLQLTMDHSTNVKEEFERIKNEHPDDDSAVINDRVKGSLKVTRAFGAGFLKQPKWNNALLEMFKIEYVGTSPYLSCSPSLYHHRLGLKDRFLILSSDGLYQYFTNQEAVSQVEMFLASSPEGDPAQHLIEEVLFRAAKKASMDFHELLDIPQGDRRRYHDDLSIIVISLEGRIWRSSV